MEITSDIRYAGVNDDKIDLFEGQYVVENGMAYNSYVILDEQIAVMDSVDARFGKEWLDNVAAICGPRKPDYLIVQHMEPDHSGSILNFMDAYPDAKIVSAAKSFVMMQQFFGTDFSDRQVTIKDGSTLSLGRHMLSFVGAPMVHWPEVLVTYDAASGVLFSADGFGKFGAIGTDEDWACEARRYYFGIVGKYGVQVQNLLRKAAALDIRTICPLHGPILTENIGYYVDLYNKWSAYEPETKGVVIAYASAYGNTKEAAELLAEKLKEKGCPKVALNDLARCDMPEAVEDAFRYDKLVLASPTYNGGVFPFVREFILDLAERNYQNRTVGLIENGSWSPMAAAAMKKMLEECKNLKFTDTSVKIMSTLNDASIAAIEAMAEELC